MLDDKGELVHSISKKFFRAYGAPLLRPLVHRLLFQKLDRYSPGAATGVSWKRQRTKKRITRDDNEGCLAVVYELQFQDVAAGRGTQAYLISMCAALVPFVCTYVSAALGSSVVDSLNALQDMGWFSGDPGRRKPILEVGRKRGGLG